MILDTSVSARYGAAGAGAIDSMGVLHRLHEPGLHPESHRGRPGSLSDQSPMTLVMPISGKGLRPSEPSRPGQESRVRCCQARARRQTSQGTAGTPGMEVSAGSSPCGLALPPLGAVLLPHKGAGRMDALSLYLLSAPLTIPLVCCHINSFQRASSGGEAMARRRKEERRAGIASRGI